MLIAAALVAAVLSAGAPQDTIPAAPEAVSCGAGPIERQYGGLAWMVYGCSNGGVIFGGKPGTVAESSLFMWTPSGGGFELTLETGLTDAAPLAAAQAELAAMSLADLQALVAATLAETQTAAADDHAANSSEDPSLPRVD